MYVCNALVTYIWHIIHMTDTGRHHSLTEVRCEWKIARILSKTFVCQLMHHHTTPLPVHWKVRVYGFFSQVKTNWRLPWPCWRPPALNIHILHLPFMYVLYPLPQDSDTNSVHLEALIYGISKDSWGWWRKRRFLLDGITHLLHMLHGDTRVYHELCATFG